MGREEEAPASARILVAAHKPYWMPSDAMYAPVQVGAALADEAIPGYQPDNEGDNISADNPRYCELTALYWAWKNLPPAQAGGPSYLGLAHYRRHFAGEGENGTLTSREASELLKKAPVILPKARNYHIETIESHYAHTFDPVHIECLRAAIEFTSAEYLDTFNQCMASTQAHVFNMFVMERMGHKEIARQLGIGVSSSASQLLRAKRILAKEINDYIKRNN